MIGGMIAAGHVAGRITVAEPDPSRREALGKRFPGISTVADNEAAARGAALCVLAVKPDVTPEVARGLAAVTPAPLYLSVAAGVRGADLARWLGTGRVVRAMPNQGALVGRSATGVHAATALTGDERALVDAMLAAIGTACWVSREADLDAITAIAGSGPAYFFLLMEQLAAAGRDYGLAPDVARTLVTETAAAAALLAGDSAEPLEQLRRNVTSPGGTTAAAIDHLVGSGVTARLREAFERARRRAGELADAAGAH